MEDKRKAILAKLQKVMKLKQSEENLGNIEAAEKYARIISNLSMEYNIAIEELHDNENKSTREKIKESKMSYKSPGIPGNWKVRLAYVISNHNFCEVIEYTNTDKFVFIGLEHNILICRFILNFLVNAFKKIGKERFDVYKIDRQKMVEMYRNKKFAPISYPTYMKRFIFGATNGVRDKFQAERKLQQEEYGEKLEGLIKVNNSAIKDYLDAKFKLKEGRSTKIKYDQIANEGYQVGKNITINSGLKNSTDTLKTLAIIE